MKKAFVRVIASFLVFFSHVAFSDDNVMVVTTNTVPGKTCTPAFHFPAIVYQQFKGFSIGPDPLQQAAVAGLQDIADLAKKYDGNAVLNVRIEFGNRTELDEGRVLVYGTLAKCN